MDKLKFAALGTFAILMATSATTPAGATLVVSAARTQNVSCSGGICTATASDAVMNAASLRQMLSGADVTLVARTGASDIEMTVGFYWSSSHVLGLSAFHSIQFDKPVQVAGGGGLSLVTNNGGGTAGSLNFAPKGNVTFLDLSSPLTINGTAFTLVGDIASLASAVSASPTGHYALAKSYDASVDGVYATAPVTVTLSGAFEGLGNTIDGLTIQAGQPADIVGLFAVNGSNASVTDLHMTHAQYYAGNRSTPVGDVGGVAGVNLGAIRNVTVSGSVRGWGAVACGGIAGANSGTIQFVRGSGAVTGNQVGGIAGVNTGTISDSLSTSKIRGITAAGAPFAGGIAGENLLGTITNVYATGAVTGVNLSTLGGVVGNNTGSVTETYALGAVAGANNATAGGLAGLNNITGAIAQSYSTGQVTAGSGSMVGGFVGDDLTLFLTPGISASYWDMTTSGVSNGSQGAGNRSNDGGVTGLTDTQLKAGLPSGFSTVYWSHDGTTNDAMPYLLQIPPK